MPVSCRVITSLIAQYTRDSELASCQPGSPGGLHVNAERGAMGGDRVLEFGPGLDASVL